MSRKAPHGNLSADTTTTRRRQFLKAAGAVGVAGAIGLAGCSETDTTNLTLAGSEDTSAHFQAAIPWTEQVSQNTDPRVQINVQSTGGLDANVRGVGRDEFDLGATTTPNFQAAASGTRPFDKVYDGFEALFTNMVYPFPVSFTRTGTGIDYVEDLEGRTVSTGPPGSSAHTYFTIYCGVNSIDLDSMDIRRVGTDDGYRQLSEGQLDAVLTGAVNNVLGPTTQEYLQRDDKAKLVVPRDPQRTERLANAGKHIDELGWEQGGVMYDFPLATFNHAHENSAVADQDAYTTVAGTNTMFATPDLSDDVAYDITRLALENSQKLVDATALWRGFHNDPDYFATAIPPADAEVAPFNPGAVRAMKEANIWDDSLAVAER